MYSKRKSYKGRRLNKTRRKTKRSSKRRTHTRRMRGGSNMWPLIGSPYNATLAQPQGNYYAYNPKVEAWPAPSNPQFGGRRKSRSKHSRRHRGRKQRGGGISNVINSIFPLEMVNIGRSIPAGIGHMYDRFNGANSSPSSMVYPTQQPLASVSSGTGANRMMTPPDLTRMYIDNNNAVSKI